ncbi:hypothetical protein CVT24_001138 [Panaeolus cyanescens]|uniref:Retrovirus-related Pol polyprotein from transposon TNT 1-94-like beta-barrel domain-containing protein n=1 Tax=Panaeolus cyanescens TaxID=181874 RepID=A0A409YZ59_9AGAR|nr:hypothetical protein CVT24_001138 [Panaeolus cyanescens]
MLDNEETDFFFKSPPDTAFAVVKDILSATPGSNHIKIYDSGSTRHISPYMNDFTDLQNTASYSLRAANKQCFNAEGIGKLEIDVPNRTDVLKLCLNKVLYSPEVGYTLISIGRLDKCGFMVTFGNGKHMI